MTCEGARWVAEGFFVCFWSPFRRLDDGFSMARSDSPALQRLQLVSSPLAGVCEYGVGASVSCRVSLKDSLDPPDTVSEGWFPGSTF